MANGQNIDYSEKRKRPKGFICPCTGVKYHNVQTCLLVYAADSGERLQDHWSSGSETDLFLTLSEIPTPIFLFYLEGPGRKKNAYLKFTSIKIELILSHSAISVDRHTQNLEVLMH